MRAIIIEDEIPQRVMLAKQLAELYPDIAIVHSMSSLSESIHILKSKQFDLAIMDIELSDGTTFELLNRLNPIEFEIIFISAHEKYALQAIKHNVIDYILKPYTKKELQSAILKAKERIEHKVKTNTSNNFLSSLINQNNNSLKIVLKTNELIQVVYLNDIIRCESNNHSTVFVLNNGSRITTNYTLKYYENMLTTKAFFRTHQSHLINLLYLSKYLKKEKSSILLSDGSSVPLASRKKNEFVELLNSITTTLKSKD